MARVHVSLHMRIKYVYVGVRPVCMGWYTCMHVYTCSTYVGNLVNDLRMSPHALATSEVRLVWFCARSAEAGSFMGEREREGGRKRGRREGERVREEGRGSLGGESEGGRGERERVREGGRE